MTAAIYIYVQTFAIHVIENTKNNQHFFHPFLQNMYIYRIFK